MKPIGMHIKSESSSWGRDVRGARLAGWSGRILLLAAVVALPCGGTDACLAEAARDSVPAFERWPGNPLFAVEPSRSWRSIHVANADVVRPETSPDGKWRLFLRGSGRFPQETPDPERNYHDSIGLFTQEANGFSPFGPWKEHPGNPVLAHGPADGYDGLHLLDAAAAWGKDADGRDVLYLYYKGVSYESGGCVAGAASTDGGRTFTKFESNPLHRRGGPNDVVYHDGRYYLFYGYATFDATLRRVTDRLKIYLAVTKDPTDIRDVPRCLAIATGRPGSFDSRAVNGARVFRIGPRWFMIYQVSAVHFDYPERFHAAWSDDLVHWTKVRNPQPLFERGDTGRWDQGAIWTGDVFEYDGRLYMYYEGWGRENVALDRRKPYARPGRSQVGVAHVAVDRFLEWCGLPSPPAHRAPGPAAPRRVRPRGTSSGP